MNKKIISTGHKQVVRNNRVRLGFFQCFFFQNFQRSGKNYFDLRTWWHGQNNSGQRSLLEVEGSISISCVLDNSRLQPELERPDSGSFPEKTGFKIWPWSLVKWNIGCGPSHKYFWIFWKSVSCYHWQSRSAWGLLFKVYG